MKNVSRNKFLLCFRPVVDHVDDDDLVVLHTKGKQFSVERKDNNSAKTTARQSSSSGSIDYSSENMCSTSSSDASLILHRSSKKTFSRLVKAVFFKTILSKRLRDRKGLCNQESFGSRSLRHSTRSLNSKQSLDRIDHDDGRLNLVSSASLPSSFDRSKSLSWHSNSVPEPKSLSESLAKRKESSKQDNQGKEGMGKPRKTDKFDLCLLLIVSLTVTVFWGQFCAILFTSIWLYFLPRRHRHKSQPRRDSLCRPKYVENVVLPPGEKEAEDYKKRRVIMEGLLERNHHRSQRWIWSERLH